MTAPGLVKGPSKFNPFWISTVSGMPPDPLLRVLYFQIEVERHPDQSIRCLGEG